MATNEEAIDRLSIDLDSPFPTLSFGNFDAEDALLDWEAHLTRVSFESLVDGDFPEVIAEEDAGVSVFLLSDTLIDSHASISDADVRELTPWWAAEKNAAGFAISFSSASAILQSLVDLIRGQRGPGTHVYCWVS